ncbi:MAG: GDP-mannose 4,6-dehydratase [Flammeovirgaceae bacterium]
MKILVTGCAGFIGSHLTESLLNLRHKVIGIDSLDDYYDNNIKKINLNAIMFHKSFKFYNVNLLYIQEEHLTNVDLVVHLAGRPGVRPSIENPQLYIDQNISVTRSLLDCMLKKDVKKLVFASSSSIYGNIKEYPYKEEMDTSFPVSPYGFTKKSCELLNFTYHNLYNLGVVNLRFFTVYGPRQRPDLAISKFINQIIHKQPITLYGDGSSERDYTYISDIINGILASIEFLNQHPNIYQSINLGGSHPIKLLELIDTISQILEIKPVLNFLPKQAGDLEKTFADISKAQKMLGYQPKVSLKEGIREFIKWYLQQNQYQ